MSKEVFNLAIERAAQLTAKYQMILRKEFLSIEEAAIYLDKKEQFIRTLVASYGGRPPLVKSYQIGKYIAVKREDLDNYILSNPRTQTVQEIVSEISTEFGLK